MKVKILNALTGKAGKGGKTLKDLATELGTTQEALKETLAFLVEEKFIYKKGTLYTLSPSKKGK